VTLRSRLTLWYTALLVAALMVFSAAIVELHWRTLVQQEDDNLEAIGAAVARTMSNEFEETRLVRAAATEAEELPPDGVFARILDGAGHAVSGRHRVQRYSAVPAREGASFAAGTEGRRWRVVVAPLTIGGSPYFVEIAAPLDEAVRQRQLLLRACLLGLPVMIVLAGGGGWWLAQRALRPLARMALEAETIDGRAPDRRLTSTADSAELRQVAASFNRVLDRLASALADQRTFMADASHELRTPLTSIRAAADVTLSCDVRDVDEYREALAAIAQQSRRLGRIVDDMFLLARGDAGGYPIAVAEIDLGAVVVECVEDLAGRARERGIHLVVDRSDAAAIAGDESLVRRLAVNLLSNAIAYTPDGGSVKVSVTSEGDSVSLRVADTGPGVPESERERIFERFVRLDPARHEGGAGLGLSIARWIAELHGGRVAVEHSGPGGSVFVARFAASQHATS
jgi:heavy metal sensor kinase